MTSMKAPADRVLDDFARSGIHSFGAVLDTVASKALLADVRRSRSFDASLFLSQQEFDAAPQYRGVNPRPGRNLLERFEQKLGFVEDSPEVVGYLTMLLGPGYGILDKKLVVGVPESVIPSWIKDRIKENHINNLGAYVRPEYRDATYFWGIDLHQDIIDWKSRPADFVTLYVYLHEVTEADAPLIVLPESHRFGATTFPHSIGEDDILPGQLRYADGQGRAMSIRYRKLIGPAGTTSLWHACLLHGTQPDVADRERISLRYLIARDPDAKECGIDLVNQAIDGPLSLEETRRDLDADGSAVARGNKINRVVT